MDARGTLECRPFDKLFTKSVPHILEKIFFSLDHKSFKVCNAWNDLLLSGSFQKRANEMSEEEEEKLCYFSLGGDFDDVLRLLSNGVDPNAEFVLLLIR